MILIGSEEHRRTTMANHADDYSCTNDLSNRYLPPALLSLKETNKYANVIARFQLKNQTGVNDEISSLRGTKQSILVIGRAARNEAAEAIQKVHKTGLLPASYLSVAMTKSRFLIYFSDIPPTNVTNIGIILHILLIFSMFSFSREVSFFSVSMWYQVCQDLIHEHIHICLETI